MQEEIEKMEGVDLLRIYVDYENGESKNCKGDFSDKIEQELLKRLSKNNIEEFKGKLLKEIEKYAIYNNKHLKDLINNTK